MMEDSDSRSPDSTSYSVDTSSNLMSESPYNSKIIIKTKPFNQIPSSSSSMMNRDVPDTSSNRTSNVLPYSHLVVDNCSVKSEFQLPKLPSINMQMSTGDNRLVYYDDDDDDDLEDELEMEEVEVEEEEEEEEGIEQDLENSIEEIEEDDDDDIEDSQSQNTTLSNPEAFNSASSSISTSSIISAQSGIKLQIRRNFVNQEVELKKEENEEVEEEEDDDEEEDDANAEEDEEEEEEEDEEEEDRLNSSIESKSSSIENSPGSSSFPENRENVKRTLNLEIKDNDFLNEEESNKFISEEASFEEEIAPGNSNSNNNTNTNSSSNMSVEEVSSKMSDIVNIVQIKERTRGRPRKQVTLERLKLSKQQDSDSSGSKMGKIDDDNSIETTSRDADGENSNTSKLEESDGRGKRKRKPTKHYSQDMVVPRLKIRRKQREENESENSQKGSFFEAIEDKEKAIIDMVSSSSEFPVILPPIKSEGKIGRPRGSRARGIKVDRSTTPKRTRGRPRGSTLKAKFEREKATAELIAASSMVTAAIVASTTTTTTTPEVDKEGETPNTDIKIEPSETTTTTTDININISTEVSEVTTEISVSRGDPTRKRRGRGAPRGPRGPRGGSARGGSLRKTKTTVPKVKKVKKVKKPPPEKKQPQPLQVFEEETRMSADIKPSISNILIQDEESRASNSNSVSGTKSKKFTKDTIEERKPVTAETLYEYQWPADDRNADHYMLQEQVSEYLDIKSFKRKYPDIYRRTVEMEERDLLRFNKIVSETQCDLGLTALKSSDVLDIMFSDFPEKYEEYNKILDERREKELKSKTLNMTPAPPVRDRSAEFMRRILKSCSKWNANMNRDRREERSCSFDLQSFTLHVQKGRMKIVSEVNTKVGSYPVALLPGQFCDNFKKYTATELKYLPLNTVLYGPVVSQNLKNIDDSDDSLSDSDSDSSSDSSSSSSQSDDEIKDIKPIRTKNLNVVKTTELPSGNQELNLKLENGSTDAEATKNIYSIVCKSCEKDCTKNKNGVPELLIHCTKCDTPNHPTCIELTLDMLPYLKKYNWQCTDCKNCVECNDPADEDKMLFCDLCDRGYHIYCVGLRKVPNGRWHCRVCAVCHTCGERQPSIEDRTAEWHHEFRKGEKNSRFYLHSHCVSCHKLFKKGIFCPSCLKVHIKVDPKNLLECRSCEKLVHKDCAKRSVQKSMFGFMCDPCDADYRSKTKIASPLKFSS